jgi:calcium permeable stress-gated cation channel
MEIGLYHTNALITFFSDTERLAILIEQRDEILENLEIAETKYIRSFRVSTPDPSIADHLSTVGERSEGGEGRPHISRPRPLGGSTSAARRRPPGARTRARNPAYGSSSLTPTSYLLPSQYYKLRRVEGVSGGTFTGSEHAEPSFSDSWNQRVVGSRFQEISRASSIFGRFQLGQRLGLDKEGTLSPTTPRSPFSIPDPSRYGPNHPVESSGPSEPQNEGEKLLPAIPEGNRSTHRSTRTDEEDWVDLMTERPEDAMPDPNAPQGDYQQDVVDEMGVVRRRPLIWDYPPSDRRDTFPMRSNVDPTTGDPRIPPPHLRLQAQGPFVRPLTGLDHEDLGHVYADISLWRSKLKAINADIQAAQSDGYADIADGARIKGWLIIGRGVRMLPGVQVIEGRAKEDVRWDRLQNETGMTEKVVMWSANLMMGILLAAARTRFSISLRFGSLSPSQSCVLPVWRSAQRRTFTTCYLSSKISQLIITGYPGLPWASHRRWSGPCS